MSLQQQQQQPPPLRYRRGGPPRHRSLFVTRVFISIVLVTVLFALIRNLYRAMYHEPRSEAISRDLNVLYDDDDSSGGDGKDQVARRDRILHLRERMGVGLDSLPTIRFNSSSSSSSSPSSSRKEKRSKSITKDGNDNDDDKDDDNDEANERAMRERQRDCLTHGAFVSATDEFVDCRTYCNASDGVEYRYYDRLGVLLNGRTGQVGAYCMPTDAAVCNTNTSLVVYGGRDDSRWRCMPQMRAFAGEGGNMIVACDGRLLDRATGRVWHKHIDPTLAFDSIDEFLPGGGENDPPGMYRFVCPPSRDERGNWRIEAPFDRLVLLNNTCASLIPHADDSIRPDFTTGLCKCGSRARYNSKLGTCVPLDPVVFESNDDSNSEFFNSKTLETTIIDRGGPCWEPWMTLSQGRKLLNATTPTTTTTTTTTTMTLCGVEHSSVSLGAANPAFDRTRAFVFDRIVPSPAAMLLSAPSVTATPGGD